VSEPVGMPDQRRRRRIRLVAALAAVLAIAAGIAVAVVAVTPRESRFGAQLDVNPASTVASEASELSGLLSEEERKLLSRITSRPTATWVAGPTRLVAGTVSRAVDGAASRERVATLVAYNIPGRDCGSHSASEEAVDAEAYREWIAAFAEGLGKARAIVILEPDALAQLDCLDASAQERRLTLIREAVATIGAQGSWVYLDIGHSGWLPAATAADRLRQAGVDDAAGFSLNVSNFKATEDQVAYGTSISEELGGETHFVIDTSRNGVQPDIEEWCNPRGRGLGSPPTTDTGSPLVDAYLWVKTPGASDGQCNGGPPAGTWWTEYALELARNAS
jgi:endoglucanase